MILHPSQEPEAAPLEPVPLEPGDISKEELINSFPIEIGKWFKRYDEETGTFVSNVRQEYPED